MNVLLCEENCSEKREKNGLCLVDEFGAENYSTKSKTELTNCRIGYGQHIRHLLETSFPSEELDAVCGVKTKDPSGNSSISTNQ